VKYTTLIIGSGIAGLTAALRIAEFGSVLLLTKNQLLSGSTPMAQGGIAIVTDEQQDSFASHIEDTLKAGGYENDRKAVEMLVYTAPEVLKDMEKWDIHFHALRHKEGGHAVSRILNVGDKTGKTIAEHLVKKVLDNSHITVKEHFYTTDLIVENGSVVGAKGVFFSAEKLGAEKKEVTPLPPVRGGQQNEEEQFFADSTIIATGGACALFATATVPEDAIGDGIAMAIRAGARTQDLYRIQFHPTALDAPGIPKFLLSEAIRGEGAYIINAEGKRFIDELLPRDQVAKAIFEERKKGPVFLDTRHLLDFPQKFPKIFEHLTKEFGFLPTEGYDPQFSTVTMPLLPIAPAAHYFGGGISVNLDGETSLPHLFASGECTYTGVHGRNRLASNSLLEGLVYSKRIAEKIETQIQMPSLQEMASVRIKPDMASVPHGALPIFHPHDTLFITELRMRMDRDFGIVREKKVLLQDLEWLALQNPKSVVGKNMKTVAEEMWKSFKTNNSDV